MQPFELHIAASLDDALDYLARHGADTAVLAGGTDLIIRIRSGRERPARVLDISRLDELRVMDEEPVGAGGRSRPPDGPGRYLRLGALVTHGTVAESDQTRQKTPLLAEACATIGSPQIRNLGTLGGNCVTASRAGDALPALLALEAEMVLRSVGGERRVPMTEFFTGPRTTARRPDELLTHILVPARRAEHRSCFIKLGQRKSLAISVISVALHLLMDPERPSRCRSAAVAYGNLDPMVIRGRKVEAALAGRELDRATIDRAAREAVGEVNPRDDVRASADYRRAMVEALVRRGLERLAGEAPRGEPAGAKEA